MITTYTDSWSYMAHPCDIDLWVMKWRSLWPIFHGPVILPYIVKTFICQHDLTFDLKINVGQCDLYFMVQWFYLVSWRLFDVWTSYFGIISQYDPTLDLEINVGQCDLYFIGSVILSYNLKTIWCMNIILWYYESLWLDIWPKNKCRSLWPIFHGPVILHSILKTIWCMNLILLGIWVSLTSK